MKQKKFNAFDYAMDNMKLNAGVAISGMMVENINTQTGNHIDTGPSMKMIGILPMVHASKGVLMGLEDLKPKRKHK